MKNNAVNAAIAAMKAAKTYREKQLALKMALSAGMKVSVPLGAKENTIAIEIARLIEGYAPIVKTVDKVVKADLAIDKVRSQNAGITFRKEAGFFVASAEDAARAIAYLDMPTTSHAGVLLTGFRITQEGVMRDRAKAAGITLNLVKD